MKEFNDVDGMHILLIATCIVITILAIIGYVVCDSPCNPNNKMAHHYDGKKVDCENEFGVNGYTLIPIELPSVYNYASNGQEIYIKISPSNEGYK